MSAHRSSSFVRRLLLFDAVTSGAFGVLLTAASATLSSWLGIPAVLLWYAGISLFPFAAGVAWLAARESFPSGAVWTVIALNALWAIDSIALLFTGWVSPTTFGYVFVVGQALAVMGLAELQYLGLRRAEPASVQ
jgi:hypothetical protein